MKKKKKKFLTALIVILFALVFGIVYWQMYNAYLRSIYPQKFSGFVSDSAAEFGVPEPVLYAVIRTESNFDTSAVSYAGAVGLMQLMPSTFKWLTDDILGEHLDSALLNDPGVNIRYGAYLMSRLYDQYGNWNTVFAAYNAGPGNVNKWLADERYSDDAGNLTDVPFYETRRYLEIVDRSVKMYEKLYYTDKGE